MRRLRERLARLQTETKRASLLGSIPGELSGYELFFSISLAGDYCSNMLCLS